MSDESPLTLDDLQGEWKIVSFGQNGGKAPFFIPWFVKFRLRIKGDKYTKYMGEKIVGKGRLRVKPKTSYSVMDEQIVGGDEDGEVHRGIIRWVGRKIEHLQGKIGSERPEEFPYTKDSDCGYALMKRKKV